MSCSDCPVLTVLSPPGFTEACAWRRASGGSLQPTREGLARGDPSDMPEVRTAGAQVHRRPEHTMLHALRCAACCRNTSLHTNLFSHVRSDADLLPDPAHAESQACWPRIRSREEHLLCNVLVAVIEKKPPEGEERPLSIKKEIKITKLLQP